MRTSVTCIAVLAALAGLAACSKSPSTGGAPAAGTAAPAVVAPSPSPVLFQRPHPKAGLWEMAMTNDAGPGVSFTGDLCVDASTEGSAFEGGSRSRPKNCGDPKIGPAPGGGVAFDSTCVAEGRTITSHVVATGDFSSAYAMDMTTHMDPAPPGMAGGVHTHVQARWLGPCRPGQVPGHMSMKMGAIGRG